MKQAARWNPIPFVAALAAGGAAWFLLRHQPPAQTRVGAIFAFTVVLWITEAMPLGITALVGSSLLIVLAGMPEKTIFASYGDPIVPLFIGSFILAKAMETTGLSERLAWLILRRPWATRTPSRMLFTLAGVTCVISLFVSNTATTAMMLPIGMSVLASLNRDGRGAPFAVALLLTLTWASSVAVGTPVGTPPNLIAISMIADVTTVRIGFVEWMMFGMPVTVLMLFGSWGLLRLLYRRDEPDTTGKAQDALSRLSSMGRMTGSERVALAAFIVALVLWMLPDTYSAIAGQADPVAAWLRDHITAAVAALAAASMLFVIPVSDRESSRAITWREAATIDWGTILLFGGGIALGHGMFASGLAKSLGEAAAGIAGAESVWAITALGIACAIALSEIANNTTSASTLVPVFIGLSQGAGVNPIPAALGVALGASLGFMLPVSTAPNAIVYSAGMIPGKEMMRAGLLVDVLGFAIVWVCLRLILPPMGLA